MYRNFGTLIITLLQLANICLSQYNISTPDGLGYVLNQAKGLNLQQSPNVPYQETSVSPDSPCIGCVFVNCNYSVVNPTDSPLIYSSPTVYLPKLKRRAKYREALSLTINCSIPSNSKGQIWVQLQMIDPTISYTVPTYSLKIYIVSNQTKINGESFAQVGILKISSRISFIIGFSPISYNGTLDVDMLLNIAINQKWIKQYDILNQIKIATKFYFGSGSYQLIYKSIFNSLHFLDTGSIDMNQITTISLQLNPQNNWNFSANQFFSFHYNPQLNSKTNISYSLKEQHPTGFKAVYSNTPKNLLNQNFGWIQPSTSKSYFARFSVNRNLSDSLLYCLSMRTRSDFDSLTQKFTDTILRYRSIINICPICQNLPLKKRSLIGQFVRQISLLNHKNDIYYKFNFYEKAPSQQNKVTYTFCSQQANIPHIDLLFFVSYLQKVNKFLSTEVIIDLGETLFVNYGTGTFTSDWQVFSIECLRGFPVSNVCSGCSYLISGSLTCTYYSHNNSVYNDVCDYRFGWVNNGLECSCTSVYNSLTRQCSLCSDIQFGCYSCSSDGITCFACQIGFVMSAYRCSCQQYFIQVPRSGVCVACGELIIGCYQCSNASFCINCRENHFQKIMEANFTSWCKCMSSTGLDMPFGVFCQPCKVAGCSQCYQDYRFCEQCLFPFQKINRLCKCSLGHFMNSSVQCQSCSIMEGCIECESNASCTKCSINYTLSDSTLRCQQCRTVLVGCLQCFKNIYDINKCTKCLNNWILQNDQTCYCASLTPDGNCQIQCNIQKCLKCSPDGQNCIQCLSNNFELLNGRCYCNQSSFFDGSDCQLCSNFLKGCIRCSSSSECSSCDSMKSWQIHPNIPECVCLSGFIQPLNSGLCLPCNHSSNMAPGCLKCEYVNSFNCLQCDTLHHWNKSGSYCFCQQGYFHGLETCIPCSKNCKKCITQFQCFECDSSQNLTNSEYECICMENYYNADALGLTCIKCQESLKGCLTCQNNSKCISCNLLMHWILGLDGLCQCEPHYELDSTRFFCQKVCQLDGCLQCSESNTCLNCDINSGWIWRNQVCACANETILQTKGNKKICVQSIEKLTYLDCIWQDNSSLDNCVNTSTVGTKIVLNVVSTPNLILFIKVSQVYSFIDDFTYYIYHNMKYGYRFELFTHFMWNLTNQKWIPSEIAYFYYDLQSIYDLSTSPLNMSHIPVQWTILGETSNFINNTRDFWIGSIPISSVFFLFFHIFYRTMKKLKIRGNQRLIPFKWFSILLVSFFTQNIQFLSFRFFQHLFYKGSPSIQPFKTMYLLSQIACYLTMFFAVICACAGHVILRAIIGLNVKFAMDLTKYNKQAMCFITGTMVIKIINGFIHAGFYSYNITRISALFFCQIAHFSFASYFCKAFRLKMTLAFIISQYVLRAVAHLLLFLRVYCKEINAHFSRVVDDTLDEIEISVILLIFSLAVLQILTTFYPDTKQNSKMKKIGRILVKKGTKHIICQKQNSKFKSKGKKQQQKKTFIIKDKIMIEDYHRTDEVTLKNVKTSGKELPKKQRSKKKIIKLTNKTERPMLPTPISWEEKKPTHPIPPFIREIERKRTNRKHLH